MVQKTFSSASYRYQVNLPRFRFSHHSSRLSQTIRITRAGLLAALAMILSIMSHFISFPLFSAWLKFEYTSFIFLLAVSLIGVGYATIIYSVVLLLRLTYDPNPVGILALWLAYTVFCWTYWLAVTTARHWLWHRLSVPALVGNDTPHLTSGFISWRREQMVVFGGIILTVLVTTGLLVGANYGFLIQLYAEFYGIPVKYLVSHMAPFLIATTAFNLIKFSFNGCLFWCLWRLNHRLYW